MAKLEEQTSQPPEAQEQDTPGESASNKPPREDHVRLKTTTSDIETGVSQGFKKRSWPKREETRGQIDPERSDDTPEEAIERHTNAKTSQPNNDNPINTPNPSSNDDPQEPDGTNESHGGQASDPDKLDAESAHKGSDHPEVIPSATIEPVGDDDNLRQGDTISQSEPPSPDSDVAPLRRSIRIEKTIRQQRYLARIETVLLTAWRSDTRCPATRRDEDLRRK